MTGTTISNSYTTGISLNDAADNPVLVTGTISVSSGFALYGTADVTWTVTNAGRIEGASFGVLLPGGGSVTNQSTGTISADGGPGNAVQLATSVTNDGLISATGYGVFGAAYVYNQNVGGQTGTIIGAQGGVKAGSVVNAGVIEATGAQRDGVLLTSGGFVTNQSGGTIASSGYGIVAANGTVVNGGLITGSIYGVVRASYVTNLSTGTIIGGKDGLDLTAGSVVNAGSIGSTSADSTGILLASGGWVTNSGTGLITGTAYGINISGAAGTVDNAATIAGSTDAVELGAGLANLLIIQPGAVFDGIVDGGAGSSSTIELASGGAGVLQDLGSQYIDFTQVIVDPGATWTLAGDNSLGLGITLDAGATLEIAGTVASGESIMFAGSGAKLVIDSTASMAGSVANFAPGETIDLRGVAYGSVSYPGNGQLDYIAPGGGNTAFPLTLGPGGGTVEAVSDGNDGANVVICFCAGAGIATPSGEVPVEQLAIGDRVLTASGAIRPIVWIGVGHALAVAGQRGPATPVIVRKGALADNVPHRDLRVTKGHSLFVDGVLIPVELLVNQRSIQWDDRSHAVTIYHIELETHDVLLANGAPAESYRDDGNRRLFQNANTGWDLAPKPPCAPVVSSGATLQAVWSRLADRAGRRPAPLLTEDPDVHLLIDGQRIDGAMRRDGNLLFALPCVGKEHRIVSRAGSPAELGLAPEPRVLGVAILRIMLWQAARLRLIEAEDPALTVGFHGFEAANGFRWTNGDALLPAALFRGIAGPCQLELKLGCTTRYRLLAAAA